MTEAAQQLLRSFLALTEDERDEFMAAAMKAADHGSDFSPAWQNEICGRIARLESGEDQLVDGDEVKRVIFRRLGRA